MFEKINRGLMFLIIAIGGLFMILTFVDFDSSGEEAICNLCWPTGAFLGLAYVLLGLSTLAAIAGAIIGAIVNPKGIKGTLIGLGAMAVIVIISYVLASDEVYSTYKGVSATASKWSGVGLYTFYILFVLAILSIIYSAISRALK